MCTFDSELIALNTDTKVVPRLRYKLRRLGISIPGPTRVFYDDEGVVKNNTMLASTFKKKHNLITYHFVREAAALGWIDIEQVSGEMDLTHLLTKRLSRTIL